MTVELYAKKPLSKLEDFEQPLSIPATTDLPRIFEEAGFKELETKAA